jgi:hypothetical protein
MASGFDNKFLTRTIIDMVEDTFNKLLHVSPTTGAVASERDIIEFGGRMRLFPMEKFNGPAYVSTVNFYRSQKDMADSFAAGTFALFVKEDAAERLVKAFGRSAKDAEDEASVMGICAELCGILAGNLKNEMASHGYMELIVSAPLRYKNSVPEGVQFDYDLFKKQEIVFGFWKEKNIIVEACFGNIPKR